MTSASVLLVEGVDDQHVIYALRDRHGIPKDAFEVTDCKNDRGVIDGVIALKARRGELERLGVILDADEDIGTRWAQLRTRLRHVEGVELPPTPDPAGTVVLLEDERRFGAWLMPDNRSPGMLEDFLAMLRPADDVILPLVDAFLEGLPTRESCPRRFRETHRAKARIHSFLSVHDEPGKRLGQAVTARILDASRPESVPFADWLRRLFVD